MTVTVGNFVKALVGDLDLGSSLPETTPGSYELPLESDLIVTISELGKGFSMFITLAPCPKTNREALFTQMMLGNLFGQGTHGAALGISADGNSLVLSRAVNELTDYNAFRDSIEDFINVADYWHEMVKSYK